MRVRGLLGDAVCGPRPKAGSVSLRHRPFLFEGDDFGVGGLRTVELPIRHPVQLFRREMHVVMKVLMLFGSREAEMLHQEFQRLQLVRPARWNPRLCRERLQIGVGNRLEFREDVFNPNFHRLELLGLLRGNRGLHVNMLQQPWSLLRSGFRTVARPERGLARVEIDQILGDEAMLFPRQSHSVSIPSRSGCDLGFSLDLRLPHQCDSPWGRHPYRKQLSREESRECALPGHFPPPSAHREEPNPALEKLRDNRPSVHRAPGEHLAPLTRQPV